MNSTHTTSPGARGWSRVALLLLCVALPAPAAEPLSQRIEGIATYRCSACHGLTGQGNNPMFPKLAGQNEEYLVRQIMNFKTGARKGQVMLYQLGDLSAEDVAALAGYFSRQRLLPGKVVDKAMQETGRRLYSLGNAANGVAACSTCHGEQARGGGLMPRMAGQHAEYIAEQLYRFIDADRVAGQTQRHPAGLALTHDEIRAVSLFLSALE